MTLRGRRLRACRRVAWLLCAILCVLLAGCVSRNVERIDDEEAATMDSPSARAPVADAEGEAPTAEAGTAISGTLAVADDVDGVPAGVLYLIVRVAGRETGAPLAVKRLDSSDLPAEFRVSEADAMIPGTPLVGEMDVIARLDQDGDAFTEQPGDLLGRVGPVEPGDEVEIVLRESAATGSGS